MTDADLARILAAAFDLVAAAAPRGGRAAAENGWHAATLRRSPELAELLAAATACTPVAQLPSASDDSHAITDGCDARRGH